MTGLSSVYECTFQPRNLTGLDSEGVKLLNCCSESPAGMGCFHGCKVCCGVDYPADAEDCRGGAAENGSLIDETDDGGITSLDRHHAACGLGMVRLGITVGATLRTPLSGTFLH